MECIYLDHNATTPLDGDVARAMSDAYLQFPANPSSQHRPGQRSRAFIDRCHEQILRDLGARWGAMDDDRLILTSGGTEANNLAIRGLLPAKGRLLVSQVEHPSVSSMAEQLSREGYEVTSIRVTADGVVCLDHLCQELASPRRSNGLPGADLVSIMLGNNETGVLQPIVEAANVCRDAGARFHTDAVQAIGKTGVSFAELGVDAMTIAAHKFNGPKGIGGLIIHPDLNPLPTLHGGFQQYGTRPGTECPALVAGMQQALSIAVSTVAERASYLASLRDQLERAVRLAVDDVVVIGENAPRLPQTSCLAFPGVDRQALLMALDIRGLACSTGSACASGSSEPSPVLQAMGLSHSIVDSAIRLSVGMQNTPEEITTAAAWIASAITALR
jgi:cysteine desulfurase